MPDNLSLDASCMADYGRAPSMSALLIDLTFVNDQRLPRASLCGRTRGAGGVGGRLMFDPNPSPSIGSETPIPGIVTDVYRLQQDIGTTRRARSDAHADADANTGSPDEGAALGGSDASTSALDTALD